MVNIFKISVGILVFIVVVGIHSVNSELYCSSNGIHNEIVSNPFPQCVVSLENLVKIGPERLGIADGSLYLQNNTLPKWFNPELAAVGQKFAQNNAAGIYYGAFLFAIFFFADTDIRRVVVHTGKSTEPEQAFRRYLTNFMQAQMWFHDDIRLTENSENIFESLNGVRARHFWAQEGSQAHKQKLRSRIIPEPAEGSNPHGLDLRIWKAFRKDLLSSRFARNRRALQSGTEGSRLKFNQYGLAIGHFLHFGMPVLFPEKSLIYNSTEAEFMGFLHLGAFLGRAVGVEDEFNICLQPDLKTAQKYLRAFLEDHLVPTLFYLDYEGQVMFEALFKGFNNAFSASRNDQRTSSPNVAEFFLLRLLEDILEIPAAHMRKALTPREKFATNAFRIFSRPEVYMRAQSFTNSLVRRLFRIWSMAKFGIDTQNSTTVAEKAFV